VFFLGCLAALAAKHPKKTRIKTNLTSVEQRNTLLHYIQLKLW
jgi:hypothetical protein